MDKQNNATTSQVSTDAPQGGQQSPAQTETTTRILIPKTASAEIIKLFLDFQNKGKAADQARGAFNEFIRAVRLALGIATGELWDLSPDASEFIKVIAPPQGAPGANAPGSPAVPEPTV